MEEKNNNLLKIILLCCPHLSTGGLPEYVRKQIEILNNSYNVYVLEYEDITGGVLVVQKNKIRELIGDKLITIPYGGDKNIVIETIKNIKPDIIHMAEMPEYFMDEKIASQIYTENRAYKIFETSHDSSFNCNNKKFIPDKFILVSDYQLDMLKPLNIPAEVVEYPIEYQTRPDRIEALNKLGLDPEYKHVLHVGLFTPRKNQKEFFEYAKAFEEQKVIFHTVGNMADNFKFYWEPLMGNKPKNIVIHGEKTNVEDYYSAMDLFLFTSRGTVTDKETMPLVIKEAISWSIPTLIYNLPVYMNYFDKHDIVEYLEFEAFGRNVQLIGMKLGLVPFYNIVDDEPTLKKSCVIISTYPENKNIIDLTIKSIQAVKAQGYDVILTSHFPIPYEVQQMVDHVIYDSNNILTYHDFYSKYWQNTDDYAVVLNLKGENNHIYHGAAVYSNYFNGINYANKLGYENAVCFNFDMIISDPKVIPSVLNDLNTKDAIFNHSNALEGNILRTVFYGIKTDFFIKHFKRIVDEKEYNDWKTEVGSESNGLENIFYHTLKHQMDNIKLLTDNEFYNSLLNDCEKDLCSRVEYFTVLPVKNHPDKFAVWITTSNTTDNRKMELLIEDNLITIPITESTNYYKLVDFKESNHTQITLFEDGKPRSTIIVDDDYMDNNIIDNGLLTLKEFNIDELNVRYDLSDNRFVFNYNTPDDLGGLYTISITDLDTNLPIHKFDGDLRSVLWCVPYSKSATFYINYYNQTNGYWINIYDQNKTLIGSKAIEVGQNPPKGKYYDYGYPDDMSIMASYIDFNYNDMYGDICKNAKVVIDAGANVGVFTDYIMTNNPDYTDILLIEPIPEMNKILKDKYKYDPKINIIQGALHSESDKELEFFVTEGSSTSASTTKTQYNESKILKVQTVSLNAILNGIDMVDVLKLDIEGSEYEVFESLDEECLKKIKVIILECHHNVNNILREKILNKLDANGFIYSGLPDFTETNSDESIIQCNFYCKNTRI